jgi:hypothetical protein
MIAASFNTNEAPQKSEHPEQTTVADRRQGDAPKLHTDAQSEARASSRTTRGYC